MSLRHFEQGQRLNACERSRAGNSECRKRCRAGALRVGTAGIGIRVVMPRMIVPSVMMMKCARIAPHDFQATAIGRREHEPRGDECAQAQHGQHQRRRPMARASVPQPMSPASHSASNMPHGTPRIKGRITQVAEDWDQEALNRRAAEERHSAL